MNEPSNNDKFFDFVPDDRDTVSELIDIVKVSLLRRQDLIPKDIVRLGTLLHALLNMPHTSNGINLVLTLTFKFNNECNYHELHIGEDVFELSTGGTAYDPTVGGDSYRSSAFAVGIGWRGEFNDETTWLSSFRQASSREDCSLKIVDFGDGDLAWYRDGKSGVYGPDKWDSLNKIKLSSIALPHYERDRKTYLADVFEISRYEVETLNVEPVLAKLRKLTTIPYVIWENFESIDIAFNGYDLDSRELFEIAEVRAYVQQLNQHFPYWLFFLCKERLGLQCLMFCLLEPDVKGETIAAIIIRQRKSLDDLLSDSWFPAMNEMSDYIEATEHDNVLMTERAFRYLSNGPFHDRINIKCPVDF